MGSLPSPRSLSPSGTRPSDAFGVVTCGRKSLDSLFLAWRQCFPRKSGQELEKETKQDYKAMVAESGNNPNNTHMFGGIAPRPRSPAVLMHKIQKETIHRNRFFSYIGSVFTFIGVCSVVFTVSFGILLVLSPEMAHFVPIFGSVVPPPVSSAMLSKQAASRREGGLSLSSLHFINSHAHLQSNVGGRDGNAPARDHVLAEKQTENRGVVATSSASEEELLDFSSHSFFDGFVGSRTLSAAIRKEKAKRLHDAHLYGFGEEDRAEKEVPHSEIGKEYLEMLLKNMREKRQSRGGHTAEDMGNGIIAFVEERKAADVIIGDHVGRKAYVGASAHERRSPKRSSEVEDNAPEGIEGYLDETSFKTDNMPAYGKPWALRKHFFDDSSIFVSIAQFKDVLCPFSIEELYGKARNPRRIFAGIVDQRENSNYSNPAGIGAPQPISTIDPNSISVPYLDATCMPWYTQRKCRFSEFCSTDNIRVRRALPYEGKGPTWGRFYGMLMYQGEHFFMMIDSHSRFVRHWEYQIMLNLYLVEKQSAKKGRAVLSHYPPSYVRYEQLISHRTQSVQMTMCAAHYQRSGVIRMDSVNVETKGLPVKQPFSAGGFVAGDAQFVHECPFDPYLTFVFDGEEILYSVRLWTHGFDLYTPKNSILFHNYDRANAPRFWSTLKNYDWASEQWRGQMRVRHIMRALNNQSNTYSVTDELAEKFGAKRELEVYGLGKARSLEDYYSYANIDPANWTINGGDLRCKRYHRNERYRKYHKKTTEQFDEEERVAKQKYEEHLANEEKAKKQREKEEAEQKSKAIAALQYKHRQQQAMQQQHQMPTPQLLGLNF